MKSTIKLIALLLLTGLPIVAQTTIPAVIDGELILEKSSSPYLIDKNITINAGASLKVMPGVNILIQPSIVITVNGSMYVNGNVSDSVVFDCSVTGKSWEAILFKGQIASFQYGSFRSSKRFINATGGQTINISDCFIQSTAKGSGEDCIAAHDTRKININNLKLVGAGGTIAGGSKNDAIDLDGVDSCIIQNSIISNFSDDAIDIGTSTGYAFIARNIVSRANFGITIGENSKALVYRNILIFNDAGLQVHTNAVVNAWNNLFYSNTDGIECYHSEDGDVESGGILNLYNSIFLENTRYNYTTQASSQLTISNSISDKEMLAGENNLFGNAKLINPEEGNYQLQDFSPCIDKGLRDTFMMFSGLNTDIGPFEYNFSTQLGSDQNIKPQLFPNPSNGTLHYINRLPDSSLHMRIYDSEGRKLKGMSLTGKVGTLDLKELKKGIYIIKMETSNYRGTELLLIH